LPEARHLYDVRQRTYLGHSDHVQADLDYGDAAIYALLPYTVEALEVNAPPAVSAGDAVRFQVKLATSGDGDAGTHVGVVRVYRPDGSEHRHYGCRVDLPKGAGEGSIPLALNDDPGSWRIVVRDVATGVEGKATFTLSPHMARP
jgi:hypothetical protein